MARPCQWCVIFTPAVCRAATSSPHLCRVSQPSGGDVPGKRDRPEASAVIFWVGWRGVPLLLQVSKSGVRPSEKPFDKSGIKHTLLWDRLGGMATLTSPPDLP